MIEPTRPQGEDEFTSHFNMSLSIMQRINEIITAIALTSQRKDLDGWYNLLLVLLKEIDYRFSKQEEDVSREYQKRINPLSREYSFYVARGKLRAFTKYGYYDAMLRSYEQFLRKALDRRNMLLETKKEQTEEKDWGK